MVVAADRALKMHGGVAKSELGPENTAAVAAGFPNLRRHLENVGKFGVPTVVAINAFAGDTANEIAVIRNEGAGPWGSTPTSAPTLPTARPA